VKGRWTVLTDEVERDRSVLDTVMASLERDGFAVVEGVMAPATLIAARLELGKILGTTSWGRDEFEGRHTRRAYALFAKTRCLDDPATHPLVLAVLDRILGHYQLGAPAAIEIGPGESAQPLHRDDALYPVARPHAELVMTAMWPIDDFTDDNGATHVVPGSHRDTETGARPGVLDSTAVEMRAGSLLLYLGSLLHGGGANRTDRARLGVVIHYSASWLRPVENHVLAVPPGVVRGLPQRLQELLGYNVYPPFLGYVDGRHPRRVLDA
jgi:ectoine hydroxylase-related dioxygenase (phytanoyl-CoA dioxygenase family)